MKDNFLETKNIKKEHFLKFRSGDLISIKTWFYENDKKKFQTFEGIVISIRYRGINSSCIVRKISNNEGVERVFQLYSPTISSISIKKRNISRKSKLYYIRKKTGKLSKIKENIN